MQNADRQMRGIHDCFGWQAKQANQVHCQRLNLRNNGQLWDALQIDHPPRGSTSIAARSLIKREHGSVEAEPATFVLPPLMSHLLIGGDRWLTAWVCAQVARDRRLNVNRLHLTHDTPGRSLVKQAKPDTSTELYKFAAYACNSRYSAKILFTAATVAFTCASIGASAGVSNTISSACGLCSGGALRMPR